MLFSYKVEKILEKRLKKGKAEYLIKWKGRQGCEGIGQIVKIGC